MYITVRFMAKILKVESLQVTPNITGSFVDNDFFIIQKNGQSDLFRTTKSGVLGSVVFTTGNQTLSGTKEFSVRPTVNGTGVLLQNEATRLDNVVFQTGNQIISGLKDFQLAPTISGVEIAVVSAIGLQGSGSDKVFFLNDRIVNYSYSIPSNKNAMSAGPIEIANGVVVTVPTSGVWTIV